MSGNEIKNMTPGLFWNTRNEMAAPANGAMPNQALVRAAPRCALKR